MKPQVKRQHHVWRRYFLSWANDNKVYAYIGKKICRPNAINISVKTYMYEIKIPTQKEIDLIKVLFLDEKTNNRIIVEENKKILAAYAAASFLKKRGETHEEIDQYLKNSIESSHEILESQFDVIYNKLIKNDLSFYENTQERIILYSWLSTQSLRTLGVREKVIDKIKKNSDIDVSNSWALISVLLASQLGLSLFLEKPKRPIFLIENKTDVTFLTSDQPIINLDANESGLSPENLSWYYPLGPRLALLFPEPGKYEFLHNKKLDINNVDYLNKKIITLSHDQFYAESQDIIERYLGNYK
ncbi:DUF4238 domain-containing protein [Acetobacter orientalis]|uniref:DUF4238 domain-containing protein n=1 Tax=Acetobacter orientalis TaxID=146474 RepID=UPI00209D06F9|nr:DUF4238 domain-containing protein [Acetobacter orientalis]MCP1216824.1 DUF4238 domain-containing protein [Acetobacter orientalis]MCP1219551.1 DUF4238 domain-containing protein [Acetobacter orientalis]